MSISLPILNLEGAKFECTFGRGCEGVCCRKGRPLVYAEEIEKLDQHLPKVLALLRPKARAVVARHGYLAPRRRRLGQRVMRGVDGWCVFFNQGCVLHRVGALEGDKFRYKPSVCALFPIQQDQYDRWYIRQKDYKNEWSSLFCLDPNNTNVPAGASLADEIALAQYFDAEQKAMAARSKS